MQGATTAAQLGMAGSEYAGNAGMGAAQYAGNADMNTNQYASTLGYTSANQQAAYGNQAATYAGNTQIQSGLAQANGVLGKQNAYNNMLGGIGSGLNLGAAAYGAADTGSTMGNIGAGLAGIFGL